jgi:hypothetical protein
MTSLSWSAREEAFFAHPVMVIDTVARPANTTPIERPRMAGLPLLSDQSRTAVQLNE